MLLWPVLISGFPFRGTWKQALLGESANFVFFPLLRISLRVRHNRLGTAESSAHLLSMTDNAHVVVVGGLPASTSNRPVMSLYLGGTNHACTFVPI